MKAYVGTKIILAEPEVKDEKDGYKVVYPDGYISWSPKDVFEGAYREITDDEFNIVVDSVAEDMDDSILEALGSDPDSEDITDDVEVDAEWEEPETEEELVEEV